jgi:hypothetical protein
MEQVASLPQFIIWLVFVGASIGIILVLSNKWVFNYALKQKLIYGIKVGNIHKQIFILNHE